MLIAKMQMAPVQVFPEAPWAPQIALLLVMIAISMATKPKPKP